MKYIIKGNKNEVFVNCEIYSRNSILQVAYQFIDEYYVYLDYDEENTKYMKVVLEPKADKKVSLEQASGEFVNELLNQNLREAVQEKTKSIRELVLARALYSSYLDETEESEEMIEDFKIDNIAKDWFDGKME